MTPRVLHLSDLHMGHGEAWEPLAALGELIADMQPTLLVVTGDLAHRGRRQELETAAQLLRGIGLPFLAVPGNHDIPYTVPARFTRTFTDWEHVFGETEPSYAADGVVVVGLNSVRRWRQQGGALEDEGLTRALTRLQEGPPDALRMVALHHHLAAPPWRAARKRPLSHRDDVLRKLVAAGTELVVGGHVHQGGIAERREFKALEEGPRRALVLATAPALGRPRPKRREEARGLNVYEADPASLTVRTYAWDGQALLEVGRRTFART
ncbi:MAG: metallophosphoesterase [Actinobacteria bacterium]|nr:metallophosphoesterase [Actinomycetota bacterium]